MNPFSRLIPALATLIIVIIIGTIGYHLIEGWNFLDSCYMVIITLFTVGFQEVHSLSQYGRIFTMCIIVVGVGTAVYAGSQLVKIIVEGEVIGYGRRRKMEKEIKEMKDHFIICGFG
ncbi:MAG: two pore domain potassium channel family protein [Deltaproteobacteria bacterium]|nr:two pore domain potassium channel family protein [Deltaproteobacteria bacterium]